MKRRENAVDAAIAAVRWASLGGALYVLVSLASLACGMTATQVAARGRCYEQAEAEAQARVDRECAESFARCASRDDIMAELRREQEACP